MGRKIELAAHNPDWAQMYLAEEGKIAAALGENVRLVHHIGSTAIPGIKAKPVIDILVEVTDILAVDARNPFMAGLGYEARGENGIPGRRYFFKQTPAGVHLFHVHVFAAGNPEVKRHLDFRDYLRTHPEDAQAYNNLKEALTERFSTDPEQYTDGKSELIREMDRRAALWKARQP